MSPISDTASHEDRACLILVAFSPLYLLLFPSSSHSMTPDLSQPLPEGRWGWDSGFPRCGGMGSCARSRQSQTPRAGALGYERKVRVTAKHSSSYLPSPVFLPWSLCLSPPPLLHPRASAGNYRGYFSTSWEVKLDEILKHLPNLRFCDLSFWNEKASWSSLSSGRALWK